MTNDYIEYKITYDDSRFRLAGKFNIRSKTQSIIFSGINYASAANEVVLELNSSKTIGIQNLKIILEDENYSYTSFASPSLFLLIDGVLINVPPLGGELNLSGGNKTNYYLDVKNLIANNFSVGINWNTNPPGNTGKLFLAFDTSIVN